MKQELLEDKVKIYFTHCCHAGSLDPRCALKLFGIQRYYHDVFLFPEVSHLDPKSISYWRLVCQALFTLPFADTNFLGVPEIGRDSHPSIICWNPRRLVVDCGIGVRSIDLSVRKSC